MGLAKDRALDLRERFGLRDRVSGRMLDAIVRQLRLEVRIRPLGGVHEVYLGQCIALNASLTVRDRRWLVPHGLAHHLFDCGNQFSVDWIRRAKSERRAELFAGWLLMGDPPALSALQLAEFHELPHERVARWLDLREGWLAISSPDADLHRYRLPAAQHDCGQRSTTRDL